jgi:TIR domain
MEFDAFISYASADKTAADAACAVLEAAGIRCWVAPRDISPGQEYAAAIIDAIDRCRVMVLIFSSSANDSPQVRREIERAASKGVAIMPVRIERIAPTKSMEYFLGDIHWLDAMTPPIENHLQQLAVTIKALLNANAAAAGEIGTRFEVANRGRHAKLRRRPSAGRSAAFRSQISCTKELALASDWRNHVRCAFVWRRVALSKSRIEADACAQCPIAAVGT